MSNARRPQKWAFINEEPLFTDGLGIARHRAAHLDHCILNQIDAMLLDAGKPELTRHMEDLMNAAVPRDEVEALYLGLQLGFTYMHRLPTRGSIDPAAAQQSPAYAYSVAKPEKPAPTPGTIRLAVILTILFILGVSMTGTLIVLYFTR